MNIDKRQFRFGMVAIEKGYVTAEQVMKALEVQIKEDQSEGSHSWIGKILLDNGFITQAQLDDVLQMIGPAE
jgi:hypothetical protein